MVSFGGPWNQVGIGNHFFIYTYMRLIAENLNYKLVSEPMNFSERNGIHPQGSYQFKNIDDGIDNKNNEMYCIDDGFANSFNNVDNISEHFRNKNYHIKSCGYFQKYSYWKTHKNKVKNFYKDFISNEKKTSDDVAIHLRKSYQDFRISLDTQYYINSIESIGAKNIYLFADNFNRHDELLEKLKPYNPILMNLNVPDTIKEITKFDKIICSQGSFSFWVAFLSNASKIVWPITKIGPNKKYDNWSIDYVIDDESRYEFIFL